MPQITCHSSRQSGGYRRNSRSSSAQIAASRSSLRLQKIAPNCQQAVSGENSKLIIWRWRSVLSHIDRTKPINRPLQSIFQLNRWLPLQHASRERDVWATLLWIILRQWPCQFDLRRTPNQSNHTLGQFANRELNRIPDIHWPSEIIWRIHRKD